MQNTEKKETKKGFQGRPFYLSWDPFPFFCFRVRHRKEIIIPQVPHFPAYFPGSPTGLHFLRNNDFVTGQTDSPPARLYKKTP